MLITVFFLRTSSHFHILGSVKNPIVVGVAWFPHSFRESSPDCLEVLAAHARHDLALGKTPKPGCPKGYANVLGVGSDNCIGKKSAHVQP